MKARLLKTKLWLRHMPPSLVGWVKKEGCRIGTALLSGRLAVYVLIVCIALELCILGIGVSRQWQIAARQAQESARAELALLEAKSFARENRPGSAGLGVPVPEDEDVYPPTQEKGDAADDAPALRVRDVETIVAQETGELLTSLDDDLGSLDEGAGGEQDATGEKNTGGSGLAGSDQDEEGPAHHGGVATNDMGVPLDKDDADELDRLIRAGVTALTAGDMRLCILSLEQAAALSPNHPAMLYYFGMAYDKLLNPAKARAYYTKVFNMRDKAGNYFKRASRRLTYGFDQTSALRGKISFGPCHMNRSYSREEGERVDMCLPLLVAPGEEIDSGKIYVRVQFFVLVNNRRIEFAHVDPVLSFENEKQTWENNEEDILVNYVMPPLTPDEVDAYGDISFYGFTAKLFYDQEPMDCISSPSALILHEQMLLQRRSRTRHYRQDNGLLPMEDDPEAEPATPYSEFLDQLNIPSL